MSSTSCCAPRGPRSPCGRRAGAGRAQPQDLAAQLLAAGRRRADHDRPLGSTHEAPLSAVAVLLLYVAAVTAFGTWLGRRRRSVKDYFLGGHEIPWWAIASCIVATETSTLTFIGAPGRAYRGDWTFLQLVLGYVVGRFLIAALFLPAYFRGEIYTSYELLQKRFGGRRAGRVVGNLPALPHAGRRHPAPRGRRWCWRWRPVSRAGSGSSS